MLGLNVRCNLSDMLIRLEKATGIPVDSIPYDDEDIYFLLFGADNTRAFMPQEFFDICPGLISNFADLYRTAGIYSYYYLLPESVCEDISQNEAVFNFVPHCREEYNRLCGMYGCCPCTEGGFSDLFYQICLVSCSILPGAEVYSYAKQIAAMQWYMNNYYDDVVKCKLDMLESEIKDVRARDSFLFCRLSPDESGLESAIWFDCLGSKRNREPYYLEGDNLRTAKEIDAVNAVFTGDSETDAKLKELIIDHWNHKITDLCLLNCFVMYLGLQRKSSSQKRVFTGGSKSVAILDEKAKLKIDKYISDGAEILVGDCDGADKLIQEHLASQGYRNVTVYATDGKVRNNAGNWPVVNVPSNGETGYEYYQLKDIRMAEDADEAFMIWDGKSRGTRFNIEKMQSLGKKVTLEKRFEELPPLTEKFDKNYVINRGGLDVRLLDDSGYTILHRPYFAMKDSTHNKWTLNPHKKTGVDAAKEEDPSNSFDDFLALFDSPENIMK